MCTTYRRLKSDRVTKHSLSLSSQVLTSTPFPDHRSSSYKQPLFFEMFMTADVKDSTVYMCLWTEVTRTTQTTVIMFMSCR